MRRPLPVRILSLIALVSVGAGMLSIAVALAALVISPGSGIVTSFIRGALSALGYSHEAFGAYEFGEVVGGTTFVALPPLAILLALRTRRLWLLRTAAVFWVLVAVSNGAWTLLPLSAVVLSLLRQVPRYFRQTPEDQDEAVVSELERIKAG